MRNRLVDRHFLCGTDKKRHILAARQPAGDRETAFSSGKNQLAR
jgi:hypothetical protein